jgi:pimeloyl-ACP methyl ester carboxylesterase
MARSDRLPGFAGEAARTTFLAVYDRALERLWSVPVRSEDIPVTAGTVRIYRAGPEDGDPVVLLTGASGNALAWYRWMDRFGDRPVIAVDPLGEPGRSVQTAPVSGPEATARWVEELFAAVDAERVHLVGVSWGGYLALEHEIRHPGRVAAITLVDPAGLGPIPLRLWAWIIVGGLAALLPRPLRRWAGRRMRNATLAEDELIAVLRASFGYRRPIARVPVLTDEELAAVGVPVQVLVGGRSPLRATAVERVHAVVPDWRVEVFPEAGHALVMDAEAAVVERVLAFPASRP